ncbi:MAG TPA: c-type cytochrome [Opitutaceae bacterium]|nr:c-type cytochrome [Opitutaceae bacterium]
MKPAHIATFAAAGLLAGCDGSAPADTTASPPDFVESALPVPADPVMALGQRVYRGDCYNCHDRGKKGAPRIASREDWTPRLTQGLETLVAHATQGFSGPTGSEMPARGGNEALTDSEIAAAVQYMASQIR